MKTRSDMLLESSRLCADGPYFNEKGVEADLHLVKAMCNKIDMAYQFAFQLKNVAETDHPEFAEMAEYLLKTLDEA